MVKLKMRMLLALVTAGLAFGSVARADIGLVQREKVAYSVSLIDAGDDGSGNSLSGTKPSDTTRYVRVKVTVSIPRDGTTYRVPVSAVPARLLFRQHSSEQTAFDGSLYLTQDAPYEGGAPTSNYDFYPMPQSGSTVDMTAVRSGDDAATYEGYVAKGYAHNPARWEATYLTEAYEVTNGTSANALITALLSNSPTYEWYVASRYGLSSATRVSDIQDHGRKMTFRDLSLWDPVANSDITTEDRVLVGDGYDSVLLGKDYEWTLRTLPGWHIYHGGIGSNAQDEPGLQLLNVKGASATYNDYPRVESPAYPNGIQSVSFEAFALDPTLTIDDPQYVLVQMTKGSNNSWTDVGRVQVSTTPTRYTVDFGDMAKAGESPKFRLVRQFPLESAGQMSVLVLTIRDVIVTSAAPAATVGAPEITGQGITQPNALESFEVAFTMTGDPNAFPKGYNAQLQVKRRAYLDPNAEWYTVNDVNITKGTGKATFEFTPGTLLTNADCSTNAVEGSFFQNLQKTISGFMPGVYDLKLVYDVLGSFAAGRDVMEQRESVRVEATTYNVTVTDDEGNVVSQKKPNVLEVREQKTQHETVFARVQYRSGTNDASSPYELKTLDVPLLSSSKESDTWRIDLSRVLRLADDDTEIYAWGYDPDDTVVGDESFVTNVLSFTLHTKVGTTEKQYGQLGAVNSTVMPTALAAVPAVTTTLQEDGAPIIVTLDGLPNSHVMVEVKFPEATDPLVSIGGSYWQDFNTWYAPSMNFTATEFREDVDSVVADFNCEVGEDGTYRHGWIPDEGPLATTSSFIDRFEVFRGAKEDAWALSVNNDTEIAGENFAAWGASHLDATPTYLNADPSELGYRTEYLQLDTGVETVLTRDWTVTDGNEYRPDAQLRLRGSSQEITPLADGQTNIVLQGVGTVSFTVGRSIPYDRTKSAMLALTDGTQLRDYGFSAGIQLDSPATNCAASGYSVSYYLIDPTNSTTHYELRVTQILVYGDSKEQKPTTQAVAELYKWSGSTAERLELKVSGAQERYYRKLTSSMNGSTFAIRIDAQGYIHVGFASGLTSAPSAQFQTAQAVAPTGARQYGFAVGSAECLPTFRNVSRITGTASTAFQNPVALDASTVTINNYFTTVPWKLSKDGAATQILRAAPSADEGAVIVAAVRGSDVMREVQTTVVATGTTYTTSIGATNATLVIKPANKDANVFIDNLTVSSWNGNDANRNGELRVPSATDEGFEVGTGFSGVGVWIQPRDKRDLTVQPSQYSGEQMVLLQRSRMNATVTQNPNATDLGETVFPDGSTTNTGNALALYAPYSAKGFGTVTFSYRVPTINEFTTSGTMAPVKVMLQHSTQTSNNFLTNPLHNWTNVSEPVTLPETGDEWSVASITPRFGAGKGEELVGQKGAGTLRLVLVTKDLKDTEDPYVYIDNFTITDNAEGTLASWTAQNVKLTDAPINQLYWKDRLAGTVQEGYAPEETFAEKSVLTRALQLNDIMEGPEVDGTFTQSVLTSPELLEGAGRVTFAARLANNPSNATRLYLYASENADGSSMQAVTYVDVKNTVYQSYEIDLSKFKKYQTGWTDAGLPDNENSTGGNFDCTRVRRLQWRTLLQNDGVAYDAFNQPPSYERVLMDQVAIADPIRPSLRVATVAFSNVVGSTTPAEFDRNSPLSQPVTGAPVLRAMVALDQVQLLKKESIRVFLTFNPDAPGSTGDNLVRVTAGASYTDVLNNVVSARTDSPIYIWNSGKSQEWSAKVWFDRAAVEDAVRAVDGTGEILNALSGLLKDNTFELLPNAAGDLAFYNEELAKRTLSNGKKLTELDPNSIVRYMAWAVYQSEETDEWFVSLIEPQHYTDFPWYFPRSMNREVQTAAMDPDTKVLDTTLFSPYYWVYNSTPGEVFLNEINVQDATDAAPSTDSFFEICAPVGMDIKGWRLAETRRTTTELEAVVGVGGSATTLLLDVPDVGVVPTKRQANTSANRSFYTIFGRSTGDLYYTDGTTQHTDVAITARNAGAAQKNYWTATLESTDAASVLLYRPTGGAEHILVYTAADENNAENAMTNVDHLYGVYRAAYANYGFSDEWYQTFIEATWEQEATNFGSIQGVAQDELAKLHSRRLSKATSFPVMADTDERYAPNGGSLAYVNDEAVKPVGNTPVINSIATVDMGGFWVTRKNAVVTDAAKGPADLSILLTGTWPAGVNPTVSPRGEELPADTAHTTNASAPWVQVTPRQINPDQYMLAYTGLEQSMVMSTLEAGMGTHSLEIAGVSMNAGLNSPNTWAVAKDVLTAKLTYSALPFHTVTSVAIRMTKCEDGTVVANPQDFITEMSGVQPDGEGWLTATYPLDMTSPQEEASFTLTMGDAVNVDIRYNVEAKATFELVPGLATGMIKRVATYCGETLPAQPWWGSSFGFEVEAETDPALTRGATLSSVIVTFPSPEALESLDWAATSLDDVWTGTTHNLNGQTPAAAKALLEANGLRYVELNNATQGVFRDATVMGILSDTYAKRFGYDDATQTYTEKEPAIPFCAWGVYTFTVQSDKGNERVSFVLRQDDLATNPTNPIFTIPTWYAPLAPKSTAVPYFYLYSTPPEAAWLSEVNLAQGAGEGSYAEVILPDLRQGIVDAGVPETSTQGWSVRNYDVTGAQVSDTPIDDTVTSTYGSTSYRYYIANIPATTASQTAYTLIRPCGAAEGGVWTGVDMAGNTPVSVPTTIADETWLIDATNHVVAGVTDSDTVAGSVQLVGQTETLPDTGTQMISSDIEKRTIWTFAAESKQADNEGIPPDLIPTWNRVTIISSLRNTVYGGTLCGYQRVPGLFDTPNAVGTASTEGPITASLAGTDWVYSSANPRVLSYRPRSNYRFEQLTLPKDLIGKVMLIGKDLSLNAAELDAEVKRLQTLATTKTDAPYTDWIQMGRDGNGATRATAQTRTFTAADGTTQMEYTGVITFNPDFLESPIGADETVTFGDLDSFVVTLVFIKEPPSAENAIEMAMGQGDVKTGAWLISQTLYAIDENGLPSADKGGVAVDKPIWSDADGNVEGLYKDVHGWLYQPVVGDNIGMAAVINPELGLLNGLFAGGTLESVRDALEAAKADTGTVRPMLVWTLIDTSKVPEDLFSETPSSKAYTTFLDGWDLSKWLGAVPTIGDGITYDLQRLRRMLQDNVGTVGSLYSKAGIIPMVYTGYCSDTKELGDPAAATPLTRAQDTLLAFRTMSADELATALGPTSSAKLYNTDGLLPYTSAIEMVGTEWTEGAILRFAIVLVDTDNNTVYDCQSISNFSSEKSDAYCPWYLPDATTNINTKTKQKEKGISPYAWVYAIPQGSIWLNEVRPFAQGDDGTGNRAYSALELAMYASPYTTTTSGAATHYIPQYSLDGWNVVTKIALMPHATAALEEQIQWTELQSIPLKSWVPYRRIDASQMNSPNNPNYYDLDYYAMSMDVTSGFGGGDSFKSAPYETEADTDTFQWLKLKREIFGEEDREAVEALLLTDPKTVSYAVQSAAYAESDILYAVSLERANGVVVDELLFYKVAHKRDESENYTQQRVERAVAMENAHDVVVNEVRAFSRLPVPSAPRTLQFLKTPAGNLFWGHSSASGDAAQLITLVGMNLLGENTQPYLTLGVDFLPSTAAILSAQVVGGPGALSITSGNKSLTPASSVVTNLMRGSEYKLTLSGVNADWYRLDSVTKNGQAHTYTPTETFTIYALNAANTLSATTGIVVDDAVLEKDTDYTLTFVYTPDAEELLATGAMNSEDDGFLAWLLQKEPGAILAQTEADGITAAEKYWLGLSTAVDVAEVELTFRQIDFHLEPDSTVAQPVLAIVFTKDGAPIEEIKGDGALVLLGKETLADEWQFLRRLTTDDVNGAYELILDTPCKFFKAVLISTAQAEELRD